MQFTKNFILSRMYRWNARRLWFHAGWIATWLSRSSFFREIRTNYARLTVRIFSRISAVSFTRESAFAGSPPLEHIRSEKRASRSTAKVESGKRDLSRSVRGGGVNQDGKWAGDAILVIILLKHPGSRNDLTSPTFAVAPFSRGEKKTRWLNGGWNNLGYHSARECMNIQNVP